MKNILLGAFILSTAIAAQAQKLPGTADSSFNANGFKKAEYGDVGSLVTSGYLDNNGKPVIVGNSKNNQFKWSIGMARLNTNGTLDATFKNNGTSIIDVDAGSNELINDVFLSNSGNLWGVGTIAGPNGVDMLLIKADQNGVLDINFSNSGFFTREIDPGYELATQVLEDKNGKVLILGNAPNGLKKMFLMRVNSNGTIDSSFGGDGIALIDPLDENNIPVALMERPQGGIMLFLQLLETDLQKFRWFPFHKMAITISILADLVKSSFNIKIWLRRLLQPFIIMGRSISPAISSDRMTIRMDSLPALKPTARSIPISIKPDLT